MGPQSGKNYIRPSNAPTDAVKRLICITNNSLATDRRYTLIAGEQETYVFLTSWNSLQAETSALKKIFLDSKPNNAPVTFLVIML
jgi:hypothetical protein